MSELQQWYYLGEKQTQLGPYSSEDLQKLVSAGVIERTTKVWTSGLDDWCPASKVGGLFDAVAKKPEAAALRVENFSQPRPQQPLKVETKPIALSSTPTTAPMIPEAVAIPSSNDYVSQANENAFDTTPLLGPGSNNANAPMLRKQSYQGALSKPGAVINPPSSAPQTTNHQPQNLNSKAAKSAKKLAPPTGMLASKQEAKVGNSITSLLPKPEEKVVKAIPDETPKRETPAVTNPVSQTPPKLATPKPALAQPERPTITSVLGDPEVVAVPEIHSTTASETPALHAETEIASQPSAQPKTPLKIEENASPAAKLNIESNINKAKLAIDEEAQANRPKLNITPAAAANKPKFNF